MNNIRNDWWLPNYSFFGEFYIEGDDSYDGYLQMKKQSLAERVQAEADGIINLLQLKGKEYILDLPCGYGRHSIELAKRGFSVIGCDINPTHLSHARNKSSNLDVNLSFIMGNMLDFRTSKQFDVVINMFYSFGFFEEEEKNISTLKNFYENLKFGGKFLFHTDVNLKRVLSGKYKKYEERVLTSGKILKIIDNYDPLSKRMNGHWIIDDGVKEKKKSYSVRIYSDEEFIDLCKKSNFKNVQIFGDWNGNPYDENSEDMMIIAEK